jgi:hypothetical protein
MGAKKKRPRTVLHRTGGPKGPVVLNCYAEIVSGRQELAHAQLSVNVSRSFATSVGGVLHALQNQMVQQIVERVMAAPRAPDATAAETETTEGGLQ